MSWRSKGESLFRSQVEPLLSSTGVLVLNGDTFDFRWSRKSLARSVSEALSWLRSLTAQYPNLHFFYILGNHDCASEFVSELGKFSNLTVLPHYLILNRSLFIHGDAANWRMNAQAFQQFRRSWEMDQAKGEWACRWYNLADFFQLSCATHHFWFRGNLALKRLSWHLDRVLPGWKDSVDQCFFGHTHIMMKDQNYGGVLFHNTGSGIRNMDFAPMHFDPGERKLKQ